MATYFETNSQAVTQWGRTRRNGARVVPQVVLHTYEATWSAADGASYLTRRKDSGSYHWLVGLDQNIHLAPWSAETWQAIPVNNWSVGISAMWRAGQWGKLSNTNRNKLIKGMAEGAHKFSRWCVSQGLDPVQPRLITKEQALARVNGFVYHGTLQNDRSDPGADFPWASFIKEFRKLEGLKVSATPKPAAAKPSGKVWSAGSAPWPKAYLTVSGSATLKPYQDKALENLLGQVGHTGNLAQRLQKHLRSRGYYHGAITPQSRIGPQTIQAWQRFLKDRGFYTGLITRFSQWGPQTRIATVKFLNSQADVIANLP